MKVLDYDVWFDKYGADYGDLVQDWVSSRPAGIGLKQLGIWDLDDFIQDMILQAYEDYVSECEDRAYESFRDERL